MLSTVWARRWASKSFSDESGHGEDHVTLAIELAGDLGAPVAPVPYEKAVSCDEDLIGGTDDGQGCGSYGHTGEHHGRKKNRDRMQCSGRAGGDSGSGTRQARRHLHRGRVAPRAQVKDPDHDRAPVRRRRHAVVPLGVAWLESALPAPKAAPAAFGLGGTASEIHGWGAVVHERWASHRWTRSPIARFTDTKIAPVKLGTVELLNRF